MSSLASDVDRHGPDPRRDRDLAAVRDPALGQVLGVHEQLVAGPAAVDPLDVVEPRVVVLLVPPADQHAGPSGRIAASRSSSQACSRGRSRDHEVRGQVDAVVLVCSRSGIVGRSGPEVDALGVRAQRLEGRHAR